MNPSALAAHYAARDIEARLLAALAAAGLDVRQTLAPEVLAPLDQFHTGGLPATRELLALAAIRSDERVLDLGAGLGGPARLLAQTAGCRVDCVDLSSDYCAGARLLNRLTDLDHRIGVQQASVLALPFAAAGHDVVWMQNVGMNIADKRALYREIRRVLRPGGRFAFQEIAAGAAPPSAFPLPWASAAGESFLETPATLRALLAGCGFAEVCFDDVSAAQLAQPMADAAPGALHLGVFVDRLAEKAGNARRSLQAGEIRLVRGVFRGA